MPDIPRPRKAPSQARSRHTVEVILEAAARIFTEHGYAGANTNLIADKAGISVGSLYQYFQNKDVLVAALHQRHAEQMLQAVQSALAKPLAPSLEGHIGAMVGALLAAHMRQPGLNRMLDLEFPHFDAPQSDNATDQGIFQRVRALLDDWRAEIAPHNLALATWVILNIMQAMVHAAIADAQPFAPRDVEHAITDAVMGYLARPSRQPA
jgi:AcrR family transcriptional regulator